MEITPTDTQANLAPAQSSSATGALKAETDFETFLTLLTTQLNNQDPLKPIESTEFVAQLAQFSAVEQQVRSNVSLDRITELLGGGAADIAKFLGKEVLAPSAQLFSGQPIELLTTPDPAATSAELQVLNGAGSTVALIPIDPDADVVTWNGQRSDGGAAENGVYHFAIRRFTGDSALPETTPLTFTEVREVRLDGEGGQELILASGEGVTTDQVQGVREISR